MKLRSLHIWQQCYLRVFLRTNGANVEKKNLMYHLGGSWEGIWPGRCTGTLSIIEFLSLATIRLVSVLLRKLMRGGDKNTLVKCRWKSSVVFSEVSWLVFGRCAGPLSDVVVPFCLNKKPAAGNLKVLQSEGFPVLCCWSCMCLEDQTLESAALQA